MSKEQALPKGFKANGFMYTLHYLILKSWKNKDGKEGTTWCYSSNTIIPVKSSFNLGIPVASLEYRTNANANQDVERVSSFPIWLGEGFTDSMAEQSAINGTDRIYVRSSADVTQPVSMLTIEEAMTERNTEELQYNPSTKSSQPSETEQVSA